ncbi:radical SAM protein [Micromonospora sp. NPDC048170]|uniref:radical SAM protein n=1 Tax=Micromonospora sp. NPDC048170 TaxID=3154819 RepID=UPI0033E51134
MADAETPRRRVIHTIGETPEEFDGETYWNAKIIEFDGATYVFSKRAILTMVVVAACNAACHFCSNEITFTPSGPYLKYDERLKRIKDFAHVAGVTKIAYTGGEPTMHPQRLYDLVSQMNPGFRRARLHTNGSGLFKAVQTENGEQLLLPALIDAGMTGASVSVAHHDTETNQRIMAFGRGWSGMSEEMLRRVADFRSDRFQPRLSCVMTHDGVRTVEHILEYMKWGRELGFRNFIFRSCSEIPNEYQKPTAFSEYNDDNYIPIDPLVDELDAMNLFTKTYQQRKSDSKVDVYTWDDITFDIDESSEEPDPDRKIRRLNVMTNGVAHTSWIDPLSVLFEEDRHLAELARVKEFKLSLSAV